MAKKIERGGPKLTRKEVNDRLKFGMEVRKKLIDKGMKIYELAELLGISGVSVSCIVHGRTPGYVHRKKIAEILGINLSNFLLEKGA